MKIHYNNGQPEKEKVINGVLAIQVIGANKPVTAVLPNGRELTISLDNIEMILDDSVTDDKDKQTKVLELALSKATDLAYEWRSQVDTLSCSSCPLFDYGIFDSCKDSDEGLCHDCANRWKQELIRQAQEELQIGDKK